MFRVVTAQDPSPFYWLLCDDRRCCNATTGPASLENAEDLHRSQSAFLKRSMDEGWTVSLEVQLCPTHTMDMREKIRRAKGEQARVMLVERPPLVTVS